MKKFSVIILACLIISSCDYIGTTRVRKLIDLTTKLDATSKEYITLDGTKHVFVNKSRSYHRLSQGNIIGKPIMHADVIYNVDKKGNVSAFSTTKNKNIWKVKLAGESLSTFKSGGITYRDNKLYVTNGSRYLFVLDAVNGDEIMRKKFPDIVRTKPVIYKNNVIVQTVSNQTIAFNHNSWNLIWAHETAPEKIAIKDNVDPVIVGDKILINYSSGEFVALDANSGEEKWRYYLTEIEKSVVNPGLNQEIILTTPLTNKGHAYIATSQGKLVKINLNTGLPTWQIDAEDIQSMKILGNSLYVTTNARQIAAVNMQNGQVKWIGDLISESYKKARKAKPTYFQQAFVSKLAGKNTINVIASNGELYQFVQNEHGGYSSKPKILSIKENVNYQLIDNTGKLYLVIRNYLRY